MPTAAEQAIDNMTAAQAMPCAAPSGTAQCPAGRVRVGVFFDGTNNSMYRDRGTDPSVPGDRNAITNVVKLYDLYREQGTVQRRIYHHGVGTDSSAPEGEGSRERAFDWMGGGFGSGGKARVRWGLQQLSELFSANNNHLAREKLFDVYGFSRGAAIARDFVNEVRTRGLDNLTRQNGWSFYPVGQVVVRVPLYERHSGVIPTFLGVFDTVASFGLGGFDLGNDVAGYNLFVDHTWVRRTVHLMGEDEIRLNFPLSSLFMDPNDAGSQRPSDFRDVMVEIWYPGAHSDVGGGYVMVAAVPPRPEGTGYIPGPRGVPVPVTYPAEPARPAVKPDLSRIPLRDMHRASVRAGVPLSALPDPQVPADLEREYASYDAYRSGQPYRDRYIQTFPDEQYSRMYYEERDLSPSIVYLKQHYIHDSRWATDRFIGRRQRTVLYMGPQPERKAVSHGRPRSRL
ncbi:DUF2235 domain-containing protein [Sorangium sp. So ce429]